MHRKKILILLCLCFFSIASPQPSLAAEQDSLISESCSAAREGCGDAIEKKHRQSKIRIFFLCNPTPSLFQS